jgi:acetyl-CoA carboxylase biotin carboxyl carrier protein
MTIKEIKDLIRLIDQTDLTEFKMKDGEFELSIRTKDFHKAKSQPVLQHQPPILPIQTAPAPPVQHSTAAPPSEPSTAEKPTAANASGDLPKSSGGDKAEDNLLAIKSPIVGTFYRSSAPEKPPYIKVGDVIESGAVVCIVEAMKLFNEIESEVAGKIVKVLVDDATPVEYDQVLFLVDPNG